jgi:hypothetical protein
LASAAICVRQASGPVRAASVPDSSRSVRSRRSPSTRRVVSWITPSTPAITPSSPGIGEYESVK